MSLTAINAQVYKGTAAVTYGSGSGVSNRELQGTATITYGGAPTSNTALSLPGTSGNVMNLGPFFPSRADPSTSNIYVEAWIYLNSATNGFVFTVSDSGSEDMGLLVNYASTMQFRVWNTGGSGINSTNNVVLATATWYHVAGSFDRTNNRVYGFVNGVVGTAGVFSGTARARSSSNMTFGAGNSGTFLPLNAYIRDFRMVNGGIVPTTSFTPAQAPFRLNVPSYITGGSTVLSLAEQYFNPSWLNLPGTSGSYTALGTTHPTNFDTSATNFFVECWVYMKSIPTSTTVQYIILRGTGVYGAEDIGLRILSSGYAEFYSFGAGVTIAIPNTGVALSVNKWYHLAGSIVSSTKTVYIFLDGVLKNSATMAGAPRTTTGSNFFIGTPTIQTDWVATNAYVQDVRVVRGGTVPTTTFTPAAAPFGLASPSYVSGGTTVLSLATQYYQTTTDGLLPRVFLGPTATYPAYTTTSAPVFSTSNVAFTGAGLSSGNFINFGQTTITMSLGYSIILQFAWTGSYQPAYERVFDFGVAGGNSNAIIICRNGTSSTLTFGNFVASSAQTITSTSTFPQNTVSGTVICIYDPASTGSLKMYVNGSLQASLTGITIVPNGSFPSSLIAATNATGLDAFANVSIYSMKFYNRVLSATEIARTASSVPYIQFTSRPPLTPVLTNPGTLQLTVGQVVTISQTAPQPANGITWTFGPTGTGLNLTSTTDYGMTLTVASGVTSTLFTVTATNRAGLTTVIQFVAGSGLYSMTYPFTFTNMSATGANGPTSITYGASNPGFGTGYAMVLGSGTSTGMQRWTVPESGSYTFTVAGAGVQHLNTSSSPPYAVNYISYGAVGVCTLGLTAGHVLRILVGQQGTRGQSGLFARCGGCGGSFIYNETTSTLLLAAGGGGGHGGDPGGATLGSGTSADPYRNGTGKGDNGQLGTSGSVGRDGNGGTAGINGAGGGGNLQGYGGDGGAGFNGNGNVNTANGNSVTAAKAFINGGNGAIGGNSPGGFGGGGSGGSNGGAGAGGGGGYSGGGGGANQGNGEGGGGGGSYTVGTFTSSSATNLGMGYVIVTR
jgi:hypothetical protein